MDKGLLRIFLWCSRHFTSLEHRWSIFVVVAQFGRGCWSFDQQSVQISAVMKWTICERRQFQASWCFRSHQNVGLRLQISWLCAHKLFSGAFSQPWGNAGSIGVSLGLVDIWTVMAVKMSRPIRIVAHLRSTHSYFFSANSFNARTAIGISKRDAHSILTEGFGWWWCVHGRSTTSGAGRSIIVRLVWMWGWNKGFGFFRCDKIVAAAIARRWFFGFLFLSTLSWWLFESQRSIFWTFFNPFSVPSSEEC